MKEAWYIDALDGLSGLAFASHRAERLNSTKFELEGPAWFISAPDFRPEMVVSRAIGLAATRGSMQLGLSLDGETEVPFPTLDALVEFVRRLFIAGGGGDGVGDVGPAPPGPPDGEGSPPEEPRRMEEETAEEGGFDSVEWQLEQFAKKFQNISDTIPESDSAEPCNRLDSNQGIQVSMDPNGSPPLYLAAELLASAIISASKGQDPLSRQKRLTSGASLVRSFHWMGIGWPFSDTVDSLLDELNWRSSVWEIGPAQHTRQDPLDTLALYPIPEFVCQGSGGREQWRSAKDLLFSMLARPSCLIDSPHYKERIALLLFAAAIAAGHARSWDHWDHWDLDRRRELRADFQAALLTDTMDWIGAQLPTHAFTPALEAAIAKATSLSAPEAEAS